MCACVHACVCVCDTYIFPRNIVTAMWYLSQALGTLLNAGVAQIPHMDLLQQFFVYMALMVLVTVVFTVINRHFTYKHDTL